MRSTPLRWPTELPVVLIDDLHAWCALWKTEGLVAEMSISLSRRMTSSLGRAHYRRKHIGLQHALIDPCAADLLREVLCHEAAHLAAYELYGSKIRPHGREWRTLLASAGFPPRVTIDSKSLPQNFRVKSARRRRTRRSNPLKKLLRWIRG